ncbi:hypothetical protein Pla123a_45500 [Posidoniimonas polymericola]|uniref:DinB-like domain-containing protein n=1 Tax=Posidoniimonas polymericola TaxID=2528002 RepID=A0A5C5XZD7_9BACT|nr:DinB family protein [Posidoniimonas polymericola]TWT66852.1 hypothetical protein Pla123a_45500 [Posidoniimonas polymericola]
MCPLLENRVFENEIAINQMQLAYFDRIVAGLPAERHFHAAPGHGHSPAWVIGHLAIVGEMGCSMIGGSLTHPAWLQAFGPGSPPLVEASDEYALDQLAPVVRSSYPEFQRLAAAADPGRLAQPHGVDLFDGTPIQTVSHCVSVLLTNHFAFHLSQLSSCRRSAGGAPLF